MGSAVLFASAAGGGCLGLDDAVHQAEAECLRRGQRDLVSEQLVDNARIDPGASGNPAHVEVLGFGSVADGPGEVTMLAPFRPGWPARLDLGQADRVFPRELFHRPHLAADETGLRVVQREAGARKSKPGLGAQVVVDRERTGIERECGEALGRERDSVVHEAVHGAAGAVDDHTAGRALLDALGGDDRIIAGHVIGSEREKASEVQGILLFGWKTTV